MPHNKSPPNVIVSNYTTYHFLKFCGLAGLQLGRVSLLGVFPEAVFNGRALLGFEASCEPLVLHYSELDFLESWGLGSGEDRAETPNEGLWKPKNVISPQLDFTGTSES